MAEKVDGSGGGNGSGAAKNISLHPLAIVAISDHFTRIQMGGSTHPPNSKVLGILWGKQQGLEVVITDAVELLYTKGEGGMPLVTAAEVNKQKELYTKVFKGHEMLGWYSVGIDVDPTVDVIIHREMMKYNESPFFLIMHPSPDPESKELPVVLYESEMHLVEEEMRTICTLLEKNKQAELAYSCSPMPVAPVKSDWKIFHALALEATLSE